MKDPSQEVITAFYNALNGNLTYSTGGNDIDFRVYTSLPESEVRNYVLVSNAFFTNPTTKDKSILEGTISIEVCSGTFSRQGRWDGANSISNQVLQLLVKQTLTFDSFTITVKPFVESIISQDERQPDGSMRFIKLITLRFGTQEN